MKDVKVTKKELEKAKMPIRQTLAYKGGNKSITPKKGK